MFNFSIVLLVVFAASENLEKPLVWVPDPLVVEAPAAEAEAEAIPPEVRDVVEAPVNDGLRPPPSPDIPIDLSRSYKIFSKQLLHLSRK